MLQSEPKSNACAAGLTMYEGNGDKKKKYKQSFARDGVYLQCGQDSPVAQHAGLMQSRAFPWLAAPAEPQEEGLFGLKARDFNISFSHYSGLICTAYCIITLCLDNI